jgi:hypothetical protein
MSFCKVFRQDIYHTCVEICRLYTPNRAVERAVDVSYKSLPSRESELHTRDRLSDVKQYKILEYRYDAFLHKPMPGARKKCAFPSWACGCSFGFTICTFA